MEILEGHALGYDIGAFRTIFPRVRPSNRNTSIRSLTTRNRKIVIPWNPSLQQLMSSRLSNKLITRKGIIHVPIQRRYKRRILLNKRKPLYFKRIVKI